METVQLGGQRRVPKLGYRVAMWKECGLGRVRLPGILAPATGFMAWEFVSLRGDTCSLKGRRASGGEVSQLKKRREARSRPGDCGPLSKTSGLLFMYSYSTLISCKSMIHNVVEWACSLSRGPLAGNSKIRNLYGSLEAELCRVKGQREVTTP